MPSCNYTSKISHQRQTSHLLLHPMEHQLLVSHQGPCLLHPKLRRHRLHHMGFQWEMSLGVHRLVLCRLHHHLWQQMDRGLCHPVEIYQLHRLPQLVVVQCQILPLVLRWEDLLFHHHHKVFQGRCRVRVFVRPRPLHICDEW